jgi:hypothetical protein
MRAPPAVLFSAMFACTEPRSANPHPRSLPSPPLLRALCDLCVKNFPPLHPARAASLESALQNSANSSLQTASPRPPLHRIAKSRPLFSIACEQFCNYGGGGGSPQTAPDVIPNPLVVLASGVRDLLFPFFAPLNSFPFTLFHTLLHLRKSQLLSFQAIPNSFAKTPGVGGDPNKPQNLLVTRQSPLPHPNVCSPDTNMLVFPLQKIAWPSATHVPAPRTFSPAPLPKEPPHAGIVSVERLEARATRPRQGCT